MFSRSTVTEWSRLDMVKGAAALGGDLGSSVAFVSDVEGRGRGFIALRDIKPGEVVLVDEPLVVVVNEEQKRQTCALCMLQSPGDASSERSEMPICCERCNNSWYCGPECRDRAATSGDHGEIVCKAMGVMASLDEGQLDDDDRTNLRFISRCYAMKSGDGTGKAVVQKLLEKDHGAAATFVDGGEAHEAAAQRLQASLVKMLEPSGIMADASLTKQLYMVFAMNAFAIMATDNVTGSERCDTASHDAYGGGKGKGRDVEDEDEHEDEDEDEEHEESPELDRTVRGNGIYDLASFMNHTCLPNVARFDYVDDGVLRGDQRKNLRISFRAMMDIPAGSELLTSYTPLNWPYLIRQERLAEEYGFTCNCYRCEAEAKWEEKDDESDQGGHDDEMQEEDEDAFDHSFFFFRFLCQRDDCGGTLAPAEPQEGEDAPMLMECNLCGDVSPEAQVE